MRDIARKSGVHASTVSAVLAGKTKERRISEDVAARIRGIAPELDVAPNLTAHSIQQGRARFPW